MGLHADTMLCQGGALLASAQPSSLAWPDTHHSRTREGHLAPIGSPLVLGAVLVGEGPPEDFPDIFHVIQADCEALEHNTAEGRQGQTGTVRPGWPS